MISFLFIIDVIYSAYGPDPPEKAADMLRWLATLSYRTIEERALEFVSDQDLVARGITEVTDPAADPKEAVFKVGSILLIQKNCQSAKTDLNGSFYWGQKIVKPKLNFCRR